MFNGKATMQILSLAKGRNSHGGAKLEKICHNLDVPGGQRVGSNPATSILLTSKTVEKLIFQINFSFLT